MNLFILFFCFVIAFGAFWYGIKMIKLYLRVKKWEQVTATITHKSIVERKQTSASRAGFKPGIDYTYTYNSKTYTGNKIFLVELINGERGFLKSAAEKFIQKFQSEIFIYVNPKHPEEAVILCDGIGLYIFMLVMGLASLVTGLLNYSN